MENLTNEPHNYLNKTPKQLVETDFGDVPKEYDAFVYRFTNLENDKQYVGYHKGIVGDGYWNSSTCDEFNEIYTNSNSRLRYEILDYGVDMEMKQAEYRLLSSVDARNNDEYYNKSNGFPMYPEVDVNKCQLLTERIENKEFPVTKELIVDIMVLFEDGKVVQVRFEHDHIHQIKVRDRIDDAMGSTDKCNPIVIYMGRAKDGGDIIGDGNHTLLAADASKYATKIPVMRIPYEIHSLFSDLELETIGHFLNREAEIVELETKEQDAIKYLDSVVASGQLLDSPVTKLTIQHFGFSSRKSTAIISKYKKDIKAGKKNAAGLNFINYKAQPAKGQLADKVESERDKNTMVMSISSGAFKSDAYQDVFAVNIKTDKNGKLLSDEGGRPMWKKKIMKFLLWHPSPSAEEEWESKWSAHVRNRINCFVEQPYKIKVIIEPQVSWASNSF